MALDATHPQFDYRVPDIQDCRNAYEGERRIKDETIRYLPMTSGQKLDGDKGVSDYGDYLRRARFEELMESAVKAFSGSMHRKPVEITVPAAMEPLLDSATVDGDSIYNLYRKITEEQLIVGRVGLLVDLPEFPDPANPLPYIAVYAAEAIRNWDDGGTYGDMQRLQFVILDESTVKHEPGQFE